MCWKSKTRPTLLRLMAHGYDNHRGDWRGATLLHYCAEYGNQELAEFLLERGVAIDPVELTEGGTPLATAACCGRVDLAKFFIERGANLVAPADHPWAQPISQAIRAGHRPIVELLRSAQSGRD